MNVFTIFKRATLNRSLIIGNNSAEGQRSIARLAQRTLPFVMFCIVLLLLSTLTVASGFAQQTEPADTTTADSPAPDSAQDAPEGQAPQANFTFYLPQITTKVSGATRMGYGSAKSISRYSQAGSLRAGWYLDWTTQKNPVRPNDMEYVQMVRLHQDLECPIGTTSNRVRCPYKVPHSYTYRPGSSTIQEIAKANRGSLWLIGNEIDRIDWPGGYQDEMLPELYADAYHELYTLIKEADPTAKVANGGMVQVTPLRLQYLDRVWNAYQQKYGTEMPVDVWNSHFFILPEAYNQWGAGIPVGFDVEKGSYVFREDPVTGRPGTPMPEHLDMQLFDEQVRLFRQWMKDHGQQDKALIVSEYGALLPNSGIGVPWDDPQPVTDFMVATFNYFLDTKDCDIGYAADDCRLVQRWVWYSLDDYVEPAPHVPGRFNPFQSLLIPDTEELSTAGKAFREYTLIRERLSELMKQPY